MATQIEAEFRLRCYLKSAIPRLTNPTFGIADIIRDLLKPQRGEGGDNSGETLATRSGWKEQPEFRSIGSKLGYIQFSNGKVLRGAAAVAQSSGEAVAGFYIPGREVVQNCRVRPDRSEYPDGDARFNTMWFKAKKGAVVGGRSRWVTRSPFRAPARTTVFHAQQHPDATAEIETEKPLAPCQQWRVDLTELQIAALQKNKAGARVYWGKNLSVHFRLDNYPSFDRLQTGRGSSSWQTVQELTDFGKITDFRGDLTIRAELIAGYLVISINEYSWYFMDTRPTRSPNARDELRDFEWASAPLGISLYGVSGHIGVTLIDGKDAAGKPLEDEFERAINVPPQIEAPGGEADLRAGGWHAPGTKTKFEVTVGSDEVSYVCRLRTDGTRSPFVSQVVGFFDGEEEEEPDDFLDIAPCLKGQGKGQSAEPPIMMGKQINLTVSRTLLDQLSLVPEGRTWQDYVGNYNPVDFSVRWHFDDGTQGPWIGQIRGYMTISSKETPGVNNWLMQITLHDPMIRVNKPAASINARYVPLDYLFATSKGKSIYGADFIKFLLRIELGQGEANRMNGTGDAREFIPSGHPPFVSLQSDGAGFYPLSQPLSTSGFTFMPPWGRCWLDWVQELAKTDFCILFYGYVSGTGTSPDGDVWPCFVYGEYKQIVAGRPTHTIPDAVYNEGDENWVMMAATVARHHEREYNTVEVYSNPPGGGGNQLPFPALVTAFAQLPPSDPNAPDHSWPKTLTITRSDLYYPGVADWIALGNIFQVMGVNMQWPSVSFPGQPVQWGDKLKVKMENSPRAANGDASDPTLGIDKDYDGEDEIFRTIRTDDLYDFDRLWWKTTAHGFPISAIEKAALRLAEG